MAGRESSTPPPVNQTPLPDPKTTEGKVLSKVSDEDEIVIVKKNKEKETPADDDLIKSEHVAECLNIRGRYIIGSIAQDLRTTTKRVV
ncbi:hypothetical protein Tco_1528870 [Tanacetum coccineum]